MSRAVRARRERLSRLSPAPRRLAGPAPSPWFPRWLTRLALAALLFAGAAGFATPASAVTLVSNVDAVAEDTASFASMNAQGFRTGGNTAGYVLSQITLYLEKFGTGPLPPGVDLYSKHATKDEPGSKLADLTSPGSLASGEDKPHVYTAPANTTLAANRTYFLVMEEVSPTGSGAIMVYGDENGEDSDSQSGWSIHNNMLFWHSGDSAWKAGSGLNNANVAIHTNGSFKLEVEGTVSDSDSTAPRVTSIERQTPSSSPTNADSLTWRVTFNENVKDVGAADFQVSGTTAALAVREETASTVYDVTASGGNLAPRNSVVTLSFASDQDIADSADNALTNTTPTGTNDNSYRVDNIAPEFGSATVDGTSLVITFDEDLVAAASLDNTAFTVKKTPSGGSEVTATLVGTPAISARTVTLTLSSAVVSTDTVTVTYTRPGSGSDNKLKDAAGNEVETFPDDYAVTNNTVPTPTLNNEPTASDQEVETKEDVDYEFDAGDFDFTDLDAGDALASVKIETLPASGKGTLKLDGTAIAAGDLPKTVTKTEIDDDKLVYDPPDNANGNDYASFNFKVNDGKIDSTSAYTMTIDVDPVPDVTGVSVTSTPTSGTTPKKYGGGEKIQVTVTFDEAVDVTGDPVINLTVGTNTRAAAYVRGTGSTSLVFEYTVVSGDTDTNGVSIAANALTRDSNDKIEDSDDNAADLTHAALAAQSGHQVDGSLTPPSADSTAPRVSTAVVTAAKPAELAVTFNEALDTSSVPAADRFTVKVGGSTGPSVSSVAIDSTDATKLRLTLAVELDASQSTVTLDYTKPGTNPLKDAANNEVVTFTNRAVTNNALACPRGQPADAFWTACLTAGRTAPWTGFNKVNTFGSLTPATFTLDSASSEVTVLYHRSLAGGQLFIGFGGSVTADDWVLQVGSATYDFRNATPSGTNFRWSEPTAFVTSPARKYSVSLRRPPLAAQDSSVGYKENGSHTFSAADFNFSGSGTLHSVKIVSVETNGFLTLDDVNVTANQVIAKTDIDAAKLDYTAFGDASGVGYATFRFQVSRDGTTFGSTATMTIDVDPVPDVTRLAVTSTPRSGTTPKKYGAGETIQITTTFDEAVDVTGDPHIDLTVGTNTRAAAYVSGSGSNALVFEYTVVSGDADTDGISIAANALTLDADDKIEDSDDNAADVTHDALAVQSAHQVNGTLTPPAVTTYTLSVEAVQATVSEGAGGARFKIKVSPVPGSAGYEGDRGAVFGVSWRTVPGTADNTWNSLTGGDYSGIGGSIGLGNTKTTFKPEYVEWVRIADDDYNEGNETFGLQIESTGMNQRARDRGLRVVVGTAKAEVTIVDNDADAVVTLRTPGGAIWGHRRESNEPQSVDVHLLPGDSTSYPVTVNVKARALRAGDPNPRNLAKATVTTRAGKTDETDVYSDVAAVVFASGETHKQAQLTIPRNPKREPDEVFVVELEAPGANVAVVNGLALYTIYDNPGPRESRLRVRSDGGGTVSETGGCAVDLTVEFRDGNGDLAGVSSLAASDFTVENGSVGTPRSDDGATWTVRAQATAGFTGLMRVRLEEATEAERGAHVQAWDGAELVLRVASDSDCGPVARNELASLSLDGLDLDPAFDAATTAYTAAADTETGEVTVTAAAVYGTAQVAITPDDADTETDGHQVALAGDGTDITITVTPAEEDAAARTYTVSVNGAAVSDPDGTPAGAVALGAQSPDRGRQFFRGKSLNRANGDRVDYYTFTTDGRYALGLGVRDQSVELAVTLEDADGATVGTAGPPADPSKDQLHIEWLAQTIEPGTYYIRVEALADGATDYYIRFGLEDAPPPTVADPDGTRAGAVSLGAQSPDRGRQFFRGKSLNRANGDAVDYYTFTTDGRYALGLGVRDQSIELRVVLEDANGAAVGTAGPPKDPNKDQLYIEWLAQTIEPGTYYIRVEALEDGATEYYLRFGLTAPPPAVSVADAQAQEAPGATLDFAVTLDRAPSGTATVDYATADGSATAGEDYTATNGTLTFSAGETAKTVSVPVLDDAHDEGTETMTLRLSNAQGLDIADGEATGTITNADPVQKMWLARFGRTVGSQVVDAVADRLGAPLTGAEVTLAGQRVDLARLDDEAALAQTVSGLARAFGGEPGQGLDTDEEWLGSGLGAREHRGAGASSRAMTGREVLLGSAFHLASGGETGGPGFAAWGRVASGGFDAEEEHAQGAVRMDGEVTTGILGADAAWERWLAGVAVSVSEGEGTFDYPGAEARGTVESSLSGVHPYARVEVNERVQAWGLLGFGSGEMTMRQEASGERRAMVIRTDIDMRLGAVGARGALMQAGDEGGLDLALKADAFLVRMESAKAENTVATSADASRLRLSLEGSRLFVLGEGATLTPGLEVGLRHDGGDAETGTGVELGGRIAWGHAASGLRIEASARTLVAHEDSGYEEWGASGSVRLDPGGSGRGLSLAVAPTFGAASSGVERLWSLEDARGLGANDAFEAEGRLDAEVGYGLPVLGAFTGTPYAGLGLSDGGRDYRLGWRLTPGATALDFALGVEGTWAESANDDAAPEHGVMLRGALRW